MDNTPAFFLNHPIDRLVKVLRRNIHSWPSDDDIESEELLRFVHTLIERYEEMIGPNNFSEIIRSARSDEEMLKKIDDKLEAREQEDEDIVFARRLSQSSS